MALKIKGVKIFLLRQMASLLDLIRHKLLHFLRPPISKHIKRAGNADDEPVKPSNSQILIMGISHPPKVIHASKSRLWMTIQKGQYLKPINMGRTFLWRTDK